MAVSNSINLPRKNYLTGMTLFILAYLFNFLRTLVIIVIIYFGIRLFTRYILPMLVDKGIKNMQQKMNSQQRNNHRTSRPEGEVTIERNRTNRQNDERNQGEYVDFEEVD